MWATIKTVLGKARAFYIRATHLADHLEPAALLFTRLVLASVFWRSGLTKVDTFNLFGLRLPTFDIKSDTLFLFSDEFFGDYLPEVCFADEVPAESAGTCARAFFLTDMGAVMATIGELTLPLLLTVGLLTRFGALGLLLMTATIQLLVFPSFGHWINPAMWWVATAFVLVARGGGAWSLDRLWFGRS